MCCACRAEIPEHRHCIGTRQINIPEIQCTKAVIISSSQVRFALLHAHIVQPQIFCGTVAHIITALHVYQAI